MDLINRLSEPSTYASLASIFATLGFSLPDGVVKNLSLAGVGVFGLLGFFLKEKSDPTPAE